MVICVKKGISKIINLNSIRLSRLNDIQKKSARERERERQRQCTHESHSVNSLLTPCVCVVVVVVVVAVASVYGCIEYVLICDIRH